MSLSRMADIPAKLQEERLLRMLRARRRLKAMFLMVIHNLYWLFHEETDDEEVVDKKEALKRIVNRQARQIRTGILTLKEKAILRKHPDWRTETEKRTLNKYLGGLRCFRRYPEEVQYKLVAVSYFEYFGPNRVLVRQNHEAQAMYFILSGEVAITREVFDEIENKWITQELGRSGAGSMFGEVSLLHGMKRTATATTVTHCELLTLKKEDFNNVLKETIQARWDEIRESMRKFNYFDYWDEITISECCILSKLKTFDQNQVILGDGVGKSSQVMVYFVVEGTCAIIEHLFVVEKIKRGIKTYKLYEPPPPPAESTVDVEVNLKIDEKPEIIEISKLTTENLDNIEDAEIVQKEDDNETNNNKNNSNLSLKSAGSNENVNSKVTFSKTEIITIKNKSSMQSIGSIDSIPEVKHSVDKHKFSFEDSFKSGYPTIEEIRNFGQSQRPSTVSTSQRKTKTIPTDNLPPYVKIRFMQVCTLGEKSSFTNYLLDHRRVVALTPVKCILIPKYWLIQHNKGNVWTRVMQYFSWRMPTHEQVFKEYVAHKKWTDYKKSLAADILQNKNKVNNTTIHDVPYSIRVMNQMD